MPVPKRVQVRRWLLETARETARTISTYSRVRWIGLAKGCPCQPSATCGPLTPSPIRKRPPESASSVIAVIAAIAGVRAGICMIPVPTWTRVVRAAIQAAGTTASDPYASAVQIESKPRRSASRTRSRSSWNFGPE